jgi:hypothetical protein
LNSFVADCFVAYRLRYFVPERFLDALQSGIVRFINVNLTILDDESSPAVHQAKTSFLLDVIQVHFMFGGHSG